MRLVNKVVLASMNPGKFSEFKALLQAYPNIELIPAEGLISNAEKLGHAEAFDTYLENAIAKARLANQACHYPALSDDSGLEITALAGKPGVRSHRYAVIEAKGSFVSRISQDRANIDKVIQELKGKTGSDRAAQFVATVCLCVEGILIHATGTLEGIIVEQPRGGNGFGYDSIFQPKESTKTLAEMNDNEKNAISHRSRAIHELMAQVKARGLVLAKP